MVTPPQMRTELHRVGLACNDLTDSSLQGSIDTVRASFVTMPQPNASYLIGEQVTESDFSAGMVLAGVRELLPAVQAAPLPARLLVSFLASTNPGTRAFVEQLVANDTVAGDFHAQVIGSRPEAEAFVGRVANAGQDAFLSLVEDLESPALRYLSILADSGVQPTAVGSWVPKAGGVACEAQLTTMYKNWDRMKANMGDMFVGVDNTWPSNEENYTNNEAFEALYERIALQASAALVAGLDKPDMEAMLHNRIKQDTGYNPNDYDSGPQIMTVFLVGDYNPSTNTSEGLGFLTVNYQIHMRDARTKSKHDHDPKTLITGRCQGCMFTDLTIFNNHATAAGWTGGSCQ
jgi:hypothetical protein